MLAFSTCWNNSRHTDGEAMIDEILELGFSNIELSHGMTIAKYPGILNAFQSHKFTCSGVHNYFPAPLEVMIDAPDAFEFTSNKSYDRWKVMTLTRKTIETAAKFNARYVVLHMGSVPMRHDKWSHKLTEMAANEEKETAQFKKLQTKFIAKRAKYTKKYYTRAVVALEELAEVAKEYEIPLAIESRSRYEDVPSEPEMRALQEHFKDNPWIGYWHDFGHVQLKHNINLLDHQQWIADMEPYLLGCHLHDVQYPAKDHRAPFCGELNFEELLKYISPEKPTVWEISSSQSTQAIQEALRQWKHYFPDRV